MGAMLANIGATLKRIGSALASRLRFGSSPTRRPDPTGPARDTLHRCLDTIKGLGRKHSDGELPADFFKPVDLKTLNARVRIGREAEGESWRSVLIVEICGTIKAPEGGQHVGLEIALGDVTDPAAPPMAVLNRPKQGPLVTTSFFTFQADMGKLCNDTTVLQDWTTVAQLSPECFVLPRQGRRNLRYNLSIVSRQTGERLARATCEAMFENIEIGYLDVEDNIQRAKTLAVGLAFSVGAADNELLDCEIDVIFSWVRTNFGSGDTAPEASMELERALNKTASFFRKGGRLNLQNVCQEMVQIAPMVGRIDILDLSLRVAGVKGQVTAVEMTLLKEMADRLEIDRSRLRAMIEKILPVHMHETQDAEVVLGVTDCMSKDEARHQLNREYAKWSSRVISSDPAIRKQADQMLNLIAEARTQYVGFQLSKQPG